MLPLSRWATQTAVVAAAVAMVATASLSAAPAASAAGPGPGARTDRPHATGAMTAPAVFGMSARDETALRAAERTLGVTAGIVGVYADWTQPFPAADAAAARARGAVLMVSWEPWHSAAGGSDQPRFALRHITNGVYDGYIRSWAAAAAATGQRILVRFAPEMNGDWLPWSVGVNGNAGPGDYVAAWRRVVDLARAEGATNLRWVFNPVASYSGSGYPDSSYPLADLWPGDSYVDLVALDGFNWGSVRSWGWQSFDDVFTVGLAELRSVAPSHPLVIAEIGCAPGTRKAAWVTDALTRARAVGARALVWFEHRKETDWRITADRKAVKAARAALADQGWTTGGSTAAVLAALG